jgi:type VI protein secretion system component VasK
VSIAFEAQWVRWAMLGGALVVWLLVIWRWRRTRVRRDPSTRTAATRARRERTTRPDPLAELDDEAYWWERV